MDDVVKYLKALLALRLHELAAAEGGNPIRPEIVLSDVGLTAREIAELTGKTQAAVAKAISRAKGNNRSRVEDQ